MDVRSCDTPIYGEIGVRMGALREREKFPPLAADTPSAVTPAQRHDGALLRHIRLPGPPRARGGGVQKASENGAIVPVTRACRRLAQIPRAMPPISACQRKPMPRENRGIGLFYSHRKNHASSHGQARRLRKPTCAGSDLPCPAASPPIARYLAGVMLMYARKQRIKCDMFTNPTL